MANSLQLETLNGITIARGCRKLLFSKILAHELKSSPHDLAGAIVVVEEIKTVLSVGIIDNFDRQILCQRLCGKFIDGFVQRSPVLTCAGNQHRRQLVRIAAHANNWVVVALSCLFWRVGKTANVENAIEVYQTLDLRQVATHSNVEQHSTSRKCPQADARSIAVILAGIVLQESDQRADILRTFYSLSAAVTLVGNHTDHAARSNHLS